MSRRTQDPSRRDNGFDYVAVTLYGGPFQIPSSTIVLCHSMWDVLQPQYASILVWALSLSLAATEEIDVSFSSSGYLDVSVPLVCPPFPYGFRDGYYPMKGSGLPHSEIPGSTLTYSSPRHIGVCPVLHRLLAPRHPPCALCSLTYQMQDRTFLFLAIQFSRYSLRVKHPQN